MTSSTSSVFNADPALSNPGLQRQGACFDFDDMNAICADYERRIQTLTEERDDAESALADAAVKIATLDREKERLERARARASGAETERDKLKLLARDYRDRVEHLSEERDELKADLKRAHSKLGELLTVSKALTASRAQVSELEAECEKLRGIIAQLAKPETKPRAPTPPAPAPRRTVQEQLAAKKAAKAPVAPAPVAPAPVAPAPVKATPPPVPLDDEAPQPEKSGPKRRSLRSRRR